MLSLLLKYWPVVSGVGGLVLNGLLIWVAWSLRQIAKNQLDAMEVKLRAEINAVDIDLTRRHDDLAKTVDAQDTSLVKLEGRVDNVEDDIKDLPTKADIARVEGEVKGGVREAQAANAGIKRIESMLMERGMERAR